MTAESIALVILAATGGLMRIAIPHNTTKANARTTIEQKVTALLSQFGGRIDDLQQEWLGDTLEFKGKARGFKVEGTVEVTDQEIVIDGKLPFMALPFEPKIREAVKREAENLFRTA
jgi:putative polyhydroxyalkanoate system protein